MTPAITSNSVEKFRILLEEKPCYTELLERIASIWNAICTWICELFASKPLVNQNDITQRCPDAFKQIVNYLGPKDLAKCSEICKFWKITEEVWKERCRACGVTSLPESGFYVDIFKVPDMAFGPREWVKYGWGEPGSMPPLPANIKSQVAALGKTHTLTLVPKTMSFHTFIPFMKTSGLDLNTRYMPEEVENEPQEKSVWVWMQRDLEPGTRKITPQDAESKYKLGKPFWVVVSIAAEYARNNTRLFAPTKRQASFTWTSDHGRDPYQDHSVAVGFSPHQKLTIDYIVIKDNADFIGVAPAFPAES